MLQWCIRQVLNIIPYHTRSNHSVCQINWRYCDRRSGTHRKVVILLITPTRVLCTHNGRASTLVVSFGAVMLFPAVDSFARYWCGLFWYAIFLIPTVYSQVITPFLIVPDIRSGCSHYVVDISVSLPAKDGWCWVYTSPPLAYLQMSSSSGPDPPNQAVAGRISIWGNLN